MCVENETALVVPDSNDHKLNTNQNEIISNVIASEDKTELQKQLDLFNLNQAKKNVLRVEKLNVVLDKTVDEIMQRMQKRPDQISTKELVDVMDAVSDQIDRAHTFNDQLLDASKPTITAINSKTEVNINVGPVDKEGKERVMDAVTALLKQMQNKDATNLINLPDDTPLEYEDKTTDINSVNLLNDEGDEES